MRFLLSAALVAVFVVPSADAQTSPNSLRARARAAAESAAAVKPRSPFWPDSVRGPAPRAGAILPGKRIIAFYGNPLSKAMGILGQVPPPQMFAKLEEKARAWQEADSTVAVQPALELIATVAQQGPGRDGMYRLRMDSTVIERVYQWAHDHNWILVLDVQVGRSSVQAEVDALRRFLIRPDVHLAIDPEFDVGPTQRPGAVIGTTDATDINFVIRYLGDLVDTYQLPPKVLVVHRFTKPMVTRANTIQLDERVQVIMHMDGFGVPSIKKESLRRYINNEPVQWVGYKLFFKNDKPMLSPKEVLQLRPLPLFISYQ